MTATSASVRFHAGGPAGVESFLRLTGSSYICCFTYDDSAPILSVDDAHVKVSISVPDTGRVTAEDVSWARWLEEAMAQYATELEKLADANRETEGGAGQAARCQF